MLHWPAGQACASGHIMRHTKGGEFGHQRGASTAGSLGPAAQSVAPKAERSCSRSFTSTVPSSFTSTERSVPPKPVSARRQLCAIHGAMGCASVRATEDVPESKESRSLTLTRPSASCGCAAVHSVSVFVRTAVRRVHVGHGAWGAYQVLGAAAGGGRADRHLGSDADRTVGGGIDCADRVDAGVRRVESDGAARGCGCARAGAASVASAKGPRGCLEHDVAESALERDLRWEALHHHDGAGTRHGGFLQTSADARSSSVGA
jgi:hypothetical protein